MKLATYQYSDANGWNSELDVSLDSEQTLMIIFGDSAINQFESALAELKQKFPLCRSIGCSTAGEIYQEDIFDQSLSIAIIRFEKTQLDQAVVAVSDADQSEQAGRDIAWQLNKPELQAIFILSDGLSVNGTTLVKGLTDELPENVVITGGLAGDGDKFEQTWVLDHFDRSSHKVAAIGFYGSEIKFSHGSRGGWDVLGTYKEVTHSEGNVLFELDGQPALELYRKYLGELSKELPSSGLLFPLAIQNEEEIDGNTVRTILAINEEQQSITFAGDIPQKAKVQLMRANFDRLIDGAAKAAESSLFEQQLDAPVLSIAISCVGRRLVLAQRVEEEIEAVKEILPEDTQQIGFYSYGEISPLASGRCDLHNQTMTLTLIAES